jgi:hypothetical protein
MQASRCDSGVGAACRHEKWSGPPAASRLGYGRLLRHDAYIASAGVDSDLHLIRSNLIICGLIAMAVDPRER